ncbi:hypothetical protein TNCV_4586641 [Trichonephila clavipes]|nr:hypothetical protein TNCV_4586641 [Trichonephila clavipes]
MERHGYAPTAYPCVVDVCRERPVQCALLLTSKYYLFRRDVRYGKKMKINSPVSRDGCSCLPSLQTCSIGERSGHQSIVSRAVCEHHPVDKWHLGSMGSTIGVKISRICEVSKCLEGPLKMKENKPCEIAVCRSTINAGSDRWPVTCAVVISTETESGFITEDDTSPVCHTQKVGKIQSTLPMMWGQW